MAFAQGSRSRLAFGVESTFGSAASSYTNLPFNSHSLNLSKERVAGNEIQPDRMPRVDRHGNRSVAGDITVDLRDSAYDDLLESAMLSTFSTNVLKVGTTPKFLTLEDYAEDIGQARLFTGCTVSTMSVSMAPNQMVSATFGMVGKDMTISGTQKTVATAGVGEPFDAYSGSLLVADVDGIGGATALSTVTGVDFTVTNSFAPTFVVGSDSAPQLEFGRAEIEGTITAYFEDLSLVNRFLDETESAIQVSVAEGTTAGDNVMTFLFPRVKFNAADIPVDGPTSRIVTLPFVALYDDAEDPGTNLKITTSTV
jgi:hypothetical protein